MSPIVLNNVKCSRSVEKSYIIQTGSVEHLHQRRIVFAAKDRIRYIVINGLVNNVEFLGPIPNMW